MRISVGVLIAVLFLAFAAPTDLSGQEATEIDERSSKICKRQYESGYFERALKNCIKGARSGDARSYLILGLIYKGGVSTYDVGVVKYPELAYKSFLQAAELGSAQAHYLVGKMLSEGEGVDENDAEAEVWFQSASEMGYRPRAN